MSEPKGCGGGPPGPCPRCVTLSYDQQLNCRCNATKRQRSPVCTSPREKHSLQDGGARSLCDQEHTGRGGGQRSSNVEVPTLFFTAAGKPVSVSEVSMQAARARLDTDDEGGSAVKTASEELPTLFITAAGKPVSVSEVSMQAARARLDADDEGGSAVKTASEELPNNVEVPTLFITAAGKPVSVSEVSMQVSKAKIIATSENTPGAGVSLPKTDSLGGRKSGAVPPSSRFPRKSFVVPVAKTTEASTRNPGETQPLVPTVPDSASEAMGRRLRLLSFDIFRFYSLSMTVPPSVDEILQGEFCFKVFGCSPELLKLLEISVGAGDSIPSTSFRRALLSLGATPQGCSDDWCLQMLMSTLLKLRGLTLHADPPLPVFSVAHTLLYMCFKYNHEFAEGRRPALRMIMEGDVPSSSMMVVWVVSTFLEERHAPHMCTAVVSDGFYHIKVSLDVPLTNLVRKGTLRRGQKVMICGAKMLRSDCCSPLECKGEAVLSINYNCTQPVGSSTALGLYHVCPPVVLPSSVDALGGLVPSVRGIVERVLPPFFIEQTFRAARTGNTRSSMEGRIRVVRNLLAQLNNQERTLVEAVNSTGVKGCRELSRVTSFLLSCERKGDVLLQKWDECDVSCPADALEGQSCDYPSEGSEVVVFAVNPSRSRPSHPFHRTTVLYTRGPLACNVLSPPRKGFMRPLLRSTESLPLEVATGDPIDFAGLFIATKCLDSVSSHIIVALRDGWNSTGSQASYFITDVPFATSSRDIALSLPTVPFTPVIVQNVSFIRRAEDIGPDCVHVVANIFTRVYTRPAEAFLHSVIGSLTGIRESARANRAVVSRSEELLRMRALSEDARADIRRLSAEHGGTSELHAAGGTDRVVVPYYLRPEASASTTRSVTLSVPSAARTLSSEHEQVSEAGSTAPKIPQKRHVFGNIVGLRLFKPYGSGKHECIEILGNRRNTFTLDRSRIVEPPLNTSQQHAFFEADIQFGVTVKDCLVTSVKTPRALHSLLVQGVPLKRACALTVDELVSDYYLARVKILEGWLMAPEEHWWQLLTRSCVVENTSNSKETIPDESADLQWLPGEWEKLLSIISGCLKHCFFMFSVDGNEMVRAAFIKEQCSVATLMRE